MTGLKYGLAAVVAMAFIGGSGVANAQSVVIREYNTKRVFMAGLEPVLIRTAEGCTIGTASAASMHALIHPLLTRTLQ